MLSRYFYGIGGTLLAATGFYLFYSPSKRKLRDQCPGLENVGNSCFMNALLQGWAACPSLYDWFKKSVNVAEGRARSSLLAGTIFKVLKVLNNEVEDSSDPYNPKEVLYALRTRGWVITGEEQDAHELFHVLTETLDEETARYPSIVSLFDVKLLEDPHNVYQREKEAVTRSGGLLPVLPARDVEQPTRGLLASQLQCTACGDRCPVRYDIFDSLSLTFSSDYWGALTLESLLRKFVSPEVVSGVECQGCGKKCGDGKPAKSTFQKRVSIGKLPQVLCLHLPRTHWMNRGAVIKRYDHITFPETLSMDPYLHCKQVPVTDSTSIPGLMGGDTANYFAPRFSQNRRQPSVSTNSRPVNLLRTLNFDQQMTQTGLFVHRQTEPQIPSEFSDINHNAPPEIIKRSNSSEFSYRLASVVCHIGDAVTGHFVAYRRGIHHGKSGELGSRWWYTSDSSVSRVSREQVMSAEAYMLFYERVPNRDL